MSRPQEPPSFATRLMEAVLPPTDRGASILGDLHEEFLSRAERGVSKVSPVVSTEDIIAMQEVVKAVSVSLPMKEYLVNLARATRAHSLITRGTSPRGTVLLQQAVQGWAAFEGRSYAIPEDVKRVALLVVPHRIALRPGADATPEQVVKEILETIPVPL